MSYKALLLDFYGTLVKPDDDLVENVICAVAARSPILDATPLVRARWWQLMRTMCLESHGDHYQSQRDIELISLRRVLDEYQVDLDPGALCTDIFANWEAPVPYPDVIEFLNRLTVPVCIVSNIDEADIRSAMRVNHWDFPLLVTSETCHAYKPRRELFGAGLKKLGLSAREVLHAGDSVSADVIGGLNYGIDVAWVNRLQRALPSPNPTYCCADLDELAGVLGF